MKILTKSGSLYIDKKSFFHKTNGNIKFLLLILWTVFIFLFMDIRIFIFMIILGFLMLKAAKIPFKSYSKLLWFVIAFTIFNSVFLILITPQYGSQLSGKYTQFIKLNNFVITYETLFYTLTLSFKYISILPVTLLFILTTHPSKFAASLNKVGISYKIAYAVNIALRYIPDVSDEMRNIMHAQEARGVYFNKKEAGVFKVLKNYVTILIPLLISSLNRVEVISNAMDLRGFGRNRKRTWYNYDGFNINDMVLLVFSLALIPVGIYLKGKYFSNFWCP